jgi:hypothetical protein
MINKLLAVVCLPDCKAKTIPDQDMEPNGPQPAEGQNNEPEQIIEQPQISVQLSEHGSCQSNPTADIEWQCSVRDYMGNGPAPSCSTTGGKSGRGSCSASQ